MKVLYFHQHFTTPAGGGGTRSFEFAKHLIKAGHQVTMVCGSYENHHTGLTQPFCKGRRQGLVDGIWVIEYSLPYSNKDGFVKRAITFLRYAWRSVAVVFTQSYDVIFATSTPLTAAIPGILAKLLRRKRFVFEVRDLWPELPKAMGVITNPVIVKLMDWLETLSYKSADACIGLAPGIVEGIKRKVPNKALAMIPNGCDVELFTPSLQPPKFIALFAGAHGIANGLDAVLDAAAILQSRGRDDIEIHFIGSGRLKAELIARAEREQLTNCKFLTPIAKQAITSLFQNVSVGLMVLANVPAFYYGTSPNKFFDYIAAGLPVLNNYPGWLAHLLTEHQCGLSIRPDDAIAFAEALIYLADSRQELERMGKNARKLAVEKFNRDELAQQFVNFLQKVVYE